MENYEILLRDSTYKLVENCSMLRGKDISTTIDDIICEYFYKKNNEKPEQIETYFDESKEIWKDIPEYVGLYQASNMGRISSLRYGDRKIRSLVRNPTGYLQCAIRINNKTKNYLVHHLVAKAFLPTPCTDCNQIDHINHIKDDNRPTNLQWVTKSQNIKNSYSRGFVNREKNKITKRVKLFDKFGKTIGIFDSVKAAAKYLNVSMGNVSSLCNNKNGIKSLTKEKITGKFVREKRWKNKKI